MISTNASDYLVKDVEQLRETIIRLDFLLNNVPSFVFFDGMSIKDQIREDKNFVCYRFSNDEQLRFLPSGIVAYQFSLWGRQEQNYVNAEEALNQLTKFLIFFSTGEKRDKLFREYCRKLNIEPVDEGNCPRSYWWPIILISIGKE